MKNLTLLFIAIILLQLTTNAQQVKGKIEGGRYTSPIGNFSMTVLNGLGVKIDENYDKEKGAGGVSCHDDFGNLRAVIYYLVPDEEFKKIVNLNMLMSTYSNYLNYFMVNLNIYKVAHTESEMLHQEFITYKGKHISFAVVNIPEGSTLIDVRAGKRLDSKRGIFIFIKGHFIYMLSNQATNMFGEESSLESTIRQLRKGLEEFYEDVKFPEISESPNDYTQYQDWTVFNSFTSKLADNEIRAIAIDAQGNKWIGTDGGLGGLIKFDGENWTLYSPENSGLPDNSVVAITIDGKGNKWLGTWDGGLVKYDGNEWVTFDTSNSELPHNHVLSIAIDKHGNKWIGTMGGGLVKFSDIKPDENTWIVFDTSNSKLDSYDLIMSLTVDKPGNVWVGTQGLAKFDGDKWERFDLPVSYNDYLSVQSIAIDTNGICWMGSLGEGLMRFDGKNWTVFNSSNSPLPKNTLTPQYGETLVWPIAIDKNGTKWIGTMGGGLVRFDGENWTVFNKSNSGLPDNLIWSIVIDGEGNKWIGTGSGIAVYTGE